MVCMIQKKFEMMSRNVTGKRLSHIWRGYGSAIFLEFGNLAVAGKRRDGTLKDPSGEVGVMIQWSWRIEGKKSIICGSFSDEEDWERGFSAIREQHVAEITLFGRLPEIQIAFVNGASCTSFMTDKGHPSWALFDRETDSEITFYSRYGRIEVE